MKLLAICLLSIAVATVSADYWKRSAFSKRNGDDFENFKKDHNRHYVNSEDEDSHKEAFEHSKHTVEMCNNDPNSTYKCEMTDDSDATEMEKKGSKLGLNVPSDMSIPPKYQMERELKAYMKKRQSGYSPVNYATGACKVGVKSQGGCGSCWAFATTTTMEYRRCVQFKQSAAVDTFSEQELVDCSPYSSGCRGGWMTSSYKYVDGQNGLCSDKSYPYTARTQTCKASSCVHTGDLQTAYYAMWRASDNQIKAALQKYGPLAVVVRAGLSGFYYYRGGIINSQCTGSVYYDIDHAVVLVGWSNTPEPHWIVQNSWNTWWGEKGFVRIKMGKIPGTTMNYCNINAHISVPTFVKDDNANPSGCRY